MRFVVGAAYEEREVNVVLAWPFVFLISRRESSIGGPRAPVNGDRVERPAMQSSGHRRRRGRPAWHRLGNRRESDRCSQVAWGIGLWPAFAMRLLGAPAHRAQEHHSGE